jgi:hypothetical protein
MTPAKGDPALASGDNPNPAASGEGQTPVLPLTDAAAGEDGPSAAEAGADDAGAESWPELPIEQALTLTRSSALYDVAVAVASTAGDALLLYTGDDSGTGKAVFMQPFTWEGIAAEEPGRLGTGQHTSLASDGENYLACWDTDTNVRCASISLADGVSEPVLDVQGRAPAVTHALGTWYVAYAPDPDTDSLMLQPLSSNFELAAEATAIGSLGPDALPLLTPTNEGFLLVDTDPAKAYDFRSTNFGAMLSPTADPVAWDIGPWRERPSVFLDGSQVVLATPVPYGAQITTHGAEGDRTATLRGATKVGFNVAFTNDDLGPIACWYNAHNAIQRERVSTLEQAVPADDQPAADPAVLLSLQPGTRKAVIVMTNMPGTGEPVVKFVPFD